MKVYFQIALFFLLVTITACNAPGVSSKDGNKTANKLTLGFLPYKGFDVIEEVERFYKCSVIILPATNLPATAFYIPRQRYKADSLLEFQKQLVNDSIRTVVGFTQKDISTSNKSIADWGVFGLGYCPGKACVISTYRLQKAFANTQQLKERLIKVVLHELGHNLGLPHCTYNKECLLTDAAGTMAQVDREKLWLCDHCKEILHQ
jgi:archaemetzincin